MSDYVWLEPSNLYDDEHPAPLDVETYPIDTVSEDTRSFVTSILNYPTIESPSEFLHSMMRTSFYQTFLDAIREEFQDSIDYSQQLAVIYDLSKYLGSQDEFSSRVSNIISYMGITTPFFLKNYMDLGKSNAWVRNYINALGYIRQVSGSVLAYRMIPHLLFKRGTYFIKNEYPSTNVIQAGQMIKYVDSNSINRLLPSSPQTVYPVSTTIFGYPDYNLLPSRYYKYDTLRKYDEVLEGALITFDSSLPILETGKGVLVELTLDEILTHTNTIKTNSCLLDLPWLATLDKFSNEVSRASDTVSTGSQINLVALNTGYYTPKGSQEGPTDYTHPNIQAKFKQIPVNFSFGPAFVRLGNGKYTENEITSNLTDVKSPRLTGNIGIYDKEIRGDYLCLTPIIHQFYEDYSILTNSTPVTLTIAAKNTDPSEVFIELSHKNISEGTLNLELKFTYGSSQSSQIIARKLIISESYDTTTARYDPVLEVRKQEDQFPRVNWTPSKQYYTDRINPDGTATAADIIFYTTNGRYYVCKESHISSSSFETDLYNQNHTYWRESDWTYIKSKYFNDYLRSTETYASLDEATPYFPWVSGSGLDFLDLTTPTFKKSNTSSTPIYIDRSVGKIYLRPRVSATGIFAGYQEDNYYYTADTTYNINGNAPGKYETITEIGVFNEENRLMAYGTFPPIIYDSSKHHISTNLFLQIVEEV